MDVAQCNYYKGAYMRELTHEEFTDRTMAIIRAEKIFIDSGITNNITVAFQLYQYVCAEREREIFLSTNRYGTKPRTVMDRYERPQCPDCKYDMQFRVVPENDEGIKVQLVCSNKDCDTVLNSIESIEWWMENLKIIGG